MQPPPITATNLLLCDGQILAWDFDLILACQLFLLPFAGADNREPLHPDTGATLKAPYSVEEFLDCSMPCGPDLGGQKYELVPPNPWVLFTGWDWLRGENLPCRAEAQDQQLLRCLSRRSTHAFHIADLVGSIARRPMYMEYHGPTNCSSGDVSGTVRSWTVHIFALRLVETRHIIKEG